MYPTTGDGLGGMIYIISTMSNKVPPLFARAVVNVERVPGSFYSGITTLGISGLSSSVP